MPSPLPRLRLSHGQVLSIFSKVSLASDTMEDEIRYFRRLGVPFIESELGKGRGHRISYNFFHLVELAVALTALRHGMRPREAAKVLIERRARYRRLFRKEYIQQPQKALEAGWVKSQGKEIPIGLRGERYMRLHDRYSDKPGEIDVSGPDEITDFNQLMQPVERYPGEKPRPLVPITRLILQLVAWAQEVPPTRPGPQ